MRKGLRFVSKVSDMRTKEAVKQVVRQVFIQAFDNGINTDAIDQKVRLRKMLSEHKETPYSKLSKLRLLEMGLREYNSTYNRNATIEGLLEECHNLEKQIETLERTQKHQGHTQAHCYQYHENGQYANEEMKQQAD